MKLKITLVKSVIGYSEHQRNIVKALGLKKTHSSVDPRGYSEHSWDD